MSILITNIKELVQIETEPVLMVNGKDMSRLETIQDAFLFIKNGKIERFGKMPELQKNQLLNEKKNFSIQFFFASLSFDGLSITEHSAGVNDRATNADIMTDTAMVIANCW